MKHLALSIIVALALLGSVIAACRPISAQPPHPAPKTKAASTVAPASASQAVAPVDPLSATVTIAVSVTAVAQPFNPFLLGSNLPVWLKAAQLEDVQFLRRTAASGLTILRIPGGSWSDEYGWLSCETGEDAPGAFPCRYAWAAKPSDLINFFRAIEDLGRRIEPLYIVNVNYTAQEAAALVAFFNADVDDPRPIGTDRNGTDWKSAGEWAALRAAGGNPQPLGIKFWEIGNELYGGKPGGSGCTKSNGWEETWTCRGDEYMLGNASHDGFIDQRRAMLAVDPTIQVGAVGGTEAVMGNRWSAEVLRNGAAEIDYLSLHTYISYHFYGNPSKEFAEVLAVPQLHWKRMKQSAASALRAHANGRKVPLVVSEYEIIPDFGKIDTSNLMNKQVDALFLADSIGQMIVNGFEMAMQWDLMNGKSDDYGNEFGLMKANGSNARQPKYWVFPIWVRFGTGWLPVQSSARADSELSVYAGRSDDGVVSLLVINKRAEATTAQITLAGAKRIQRGWVDELRAESLDATVAYFNGVLDPADDLADAPSLALPGTNDNVLSYQFAPGSITLLRLVL